MRVQELSSSTLMTTLNTDKQLIWNFDTLKILEKITDTNLQKIIKFFTHTTNIRKIITREHSISFRWVNIVFLSNFKGSSESVWNTVFFC
jgi:hypothetical protein